MWESGNMHMKPFLSLMKKAAHRSSEYVCNHCGRVLYFGNLDQSKAPHRYILEMWKRNLNKENVIGTVLIDFRKAFDSVDDSILSYKMDACGLHGKLKDWIQSYLLDRKQFVIVNGKRPGLQIVPLLGPKLFSIFVDDLPDCISNGESTSMLMTP